MKALQTSDSSIGATLLALARAQLEKGGAEVATPHFGDDWLSQTGACFVTLRATGELRGCIGSVRAYRSLGEDVVSNTHAAAFRDPRFAPVERSELAGIEIEVSVLSPMEQLEVTSESDLLEVLQPGIDGLMIEFDNHRGTFLPAVWRDLPKPKQFLTRLKVKAGLAGDFWSEDLVIWRYTTDSFKESRQAD